MALALTDTEIVIFKRQLLENFEDQSFWLQFAGKNPQKHILYMGYAGLELNGSNSASFVKSKKMRIFKDVPMGSDGDALEATGKSFTEASVSPEQVHMDLNVVKISRKSSSEEDLDLLDMTTKANWMDNTRMVLAHWGATQFDNFIFKVILTKPTNIVVSNTSGAYKVADANKLTKSDRFSTLDIDEMVNRAKRGYAVKLVGTTATVVEAPRLSYVSRSIGVIDGVENKSNRYLLLINSTSAQDLLKDPVWIENNRYRGDNNPIFTGQLGIYNGVIVIETPVKSFDRAGMPSLAELDAATKTQLNIDTTNNIPDLKDVGFNIMVAPQALIYAQENEFDFFQKVEWKNDKGKPLYMDLGIRRIIGVGKANWSDDDKKTTNSYWHNMDEGAIVNVCSISL